MVIPSKVLLLLQRFVLISWEGIATKCCLIISNHNKLSPTSEFRTGSELSFRLQRKGFQTKVTCNQRCVVKISVIFIVCTLYVKILCLHWNDFKVLLQTSRTHFNFNITLQHTPLEHVLLPPSKKLYHNLT